MIIHYPAVLSDFNQNYFIREAEEHEFKPLKFLRDDESVLDVTYLKADRCDFIEGTNKYKYLLDELKPILDMAIIRYQNDVKNTFLWSYELPSVSCVRYFQGGFFKLHEDGQDQKNDMYRTISVLFYLGEFEGGELVFPLQERSINVKGGDIVIFPSNENYIHEAKPVKSGVKYVYSIWPLLDHKINL